MNHYIHACDISESLQGVIQARPPRFHISSQELFGILDDASEKTFLCGAAGLMQIGIFLFFFLLFLILFQLFVIIIMLFPYHD